MYRTLNGELLMVLRVNEVKVTLRNSIPDNLFELESEKESKNDKGLSFKTTR